MCNVYTYIYTDTNELYLWGKGQESQINQTNTMDKQKGDN